MLDQSPQKGLANLLQNDAIGDGALLAKRFGKSAGSTGRAGETLLIRTYSGAFAQIKPDQKIDFEPFRATPGDTAVVVRTVVTNNGQAIQIDYRLEKTEYGWRLYDWNVQGTWLTTTYQQQFAETLNQSGVDGLIRFNVENRSG